MPIADIRALQLEIQFSTYGVPAVVTRPYPDDTPVTTRGIWITPQTEDAGFSGELHAREARRVMEFRRSEVPPLPSDTLVDAAIVGGETQRWRVKGFPMIEDLRFRVALVPDVSHP